MNLQYESGFTPVIYLFYYPLLRGSGGKLFMVDLTVAGTNRGLLLLIFVTVKLLTLLRGSGKNLFMVNLTVQVQIGAYCC